MNFFFRNVILILCLSCPRIIKSFEIENDYKSKWAGIEVIGADKKISQKIREIMPIQLGNVFVAGDAKRYCEICHELIKNELSIVDSYCSILWYGDETAYLIVDFPNINIMKTFRKIPETKAKNTKLPKDLNDLYQRWRIRASTLMSSGNFPIENFDKGYRDFDDPVLHVIAEQLVQLVNKYNNNLLEIVHYSHDIQERQKAADLFSWSQHPDNLSLVLKWGLLNDPNESVRNNITRSFTHIIDKVKDEKLLINLLPAYCKQAMLPTHGDRNKALYSIREILNKYPNFASKISLECKNTINYIADTSIIDNVKNPAKDILKIIDSDEYTEI